MTGISTKQRWLILMLYPTIGLALGFADPWLGQLAQRLGTKPGVATAVSVNLVLPIAAVILAVAHARLWGAWLGAVAMAIGFAGGLALQHSAGIRDWSLAGILGSIPPVLVAATVGYALLGSIAIWVVQSQGWSSGGTQVTPSDGSLR
jgi:hypothetical protein